MFELLAFIFVVFIIFIPAIVARQRHLARRKACFWLNLFLGWTVVVWLPLLVWTLLTNSVEK